MHRALGPGLLESAYQHCLALELKRLGLAFQQQVDVPVIYRGQLVDCRYRVDLIVGETLVVEIKSVEHVLPVHSAQVLTYMRVLRLSHGLLMNFNAPTLTSGLKSYFLAPTCLSAPTEDASLVRHHIQSTGPLPPPCEIKPPILSRLHVKSSSRSSPAPPPCAYFEFSTVRHPVSCDQTRIARGPSRSGHWSRECVILPAISSARWASQYLSL